MPRPPIPDARLYRKSPGQGAKLCHMGHLTMENRHGLIVETEMTLAAGWGSVQRPIEDLPHGPHAMLAADKAYDTDRFCCGLARVGRRSARRPEYLEPTLGH